jgi:hypothetical protein
MLRDNLVELIEPMLNSAGANPLALTHHQIQASGDRLPCLENPRPKGAESSLTENVTSPFQAEPAQPYQRAYIWESGVTSNGSIRRLTTSGTVRGFATSAHQESLVAKETFQSP